MNDNGCHRLFDISAVSYDGWPALLIGVAVIAIGILAALRVRSYGLARWMLLAFGIAWTAIEIASLASFKSLQARVRRGEYESIRGAIAEYHALPPGRKGNEWFVVNGHRFEFGDASLDPGYRKTRRAGGVLKAGDVVQIAYSNDVILQLDLCEPASE